MDFLQLPGDELVKLPDEDLGQWLITAWIAFQADKAGIAQNAITREWANQIVEKTRQMDSTSVENAAIESMFRKACAGQVAVAGKMFRTLLLNLTYLTISNKHAARDMARQEGTRKPRRPELDQWIDVQLKSDPDAKSPALWSKAPEWITDQIGKDRFGKRVTAARKRVASK